MKPMREAMFRVAVEAFERERILRNAARALGCSSACLCQLLKEGGYSVRQKKMEWRLEAMRASRAGETAAAPLGDAQRERMLQMISLIKQGFSLTDIGRPYGVTRERARQVLAQAQALGLWDGIPGRSVKAQERDRKIMELWGADKAVCEIASELSIGDGTVRSALRRNGISPGWRHREQELKKRWPDDEVRRAWDQARSVTGAARILTGHTKPTPADVSKASQRITALGLKWPAKRCTPATDAEIGEALRATGGNMGAAASILGYEEGSFRNRVSARTP